jgi:acyl-CoA thioesterase FadM
VQFDYRIERAEDAKLLAIGHTRHCFLDRSGRPVRIEGELHDLLARGLPPATPPAPR